MTVWWERARRPEQAAVLEDGTPQLLPGRRAGLIAALRRRAPEFVPEWKPGTKDDAGDALVRLFGVQVEPIVARIERLDEKSLIELLSIAGVSLAPARPATSLVTFSAAAAAPASVIVPPRFVLTSSAADGSANDVSWETERAVAVLPGELAELVVFDGEVSRPQPPGEPLLPFGAEQKPGSYLLLGLDSKITPAPTLSLGLILEPSGTTPAAIANGGEPASSRPEPLMRWEALSAGRFTPIEVIADDGSALTRTGAIELRMPRAFAPERPLAAGTGTPLRWLRLRLLQGRFERQVRIARIVLNAVPVQAVRTLRDELPVPIGASAPNAFRLSQTPILTGSVVLDVDEVSAVSDFEEEGQETGEPGIRRWREVETLAGQSADARVFVLDPTAGTLQFGDDVEGRAPPAGNRSIVARQYRVASGRNGAVEAESIGKLSSSLPHLKGVSNPLPASGGSDAETRDQAVRLGPSLVRARGRAVSPVDMALFAGRTLGADIARAFARRGVDPSLPGARMAGVVGLFVVPHRRPNDPSAGPPMADSGTLAAAANQIARRVGPLGARVVAANPRYHAVRIEARVELDPVADAGATMRVLLDAIDAYLSPYVGGETGEGWPLGEPIRHPRLVRRLSSASPSVRSVPYLAIVIDEVRMGACSDAALAADGLPWPAGHELLPTLAERTP